MPRILFNLQRDARPERFDRVNEQLLTYRPDYIERFGLIGSETWWKNYHSGFISRNIQVGFVLCLGHCPEWGEDSVVVIRTDRRDLAYDLDDFWCDSTVRLNAWIRIERFKIFIPQQTGPVTEHVDTHIEIMDSHPETTV